MIQNNSSSQDRSTSPADTPGPISWWLNPYTHEFDPFLTLTMDENGRLPTQAEYDLGDGVHLQYMQPFSQNEDYALMPEVARGQRAGAAVNAFCDELNAALDAVEDQQPPVWLPGVLLIAAAFWTAVWFIWRGLS